MPGVVYAGSEVQENCGISDGTNQDAPCITYSEFAKQKRRKTYRSEIGGNIAVFVNGVPTEFDQRGDIRCSDYIKHGLFNNTRVGKLETMCGPVPISVPMTLRLKNGEIVKGTLCVDADIKVFDERSARNVMTLLNSDYVKTTNINGLYRRWISGNDLSIILLNQLQECTQVEIGEFDSVDNLRRMITERLVCSMRQNLPLCNRGISISHAFVRLMDDSTVLMKRYANEAKVRVGKAKIDSETKIMLLKLNLEEYNFVNRG